jgi:Rps23 Pro-64 3,4-dihydroxylase Tpa1-like proline 4-hydroxylase
VQACEYLVEIKLAPAFAVSGAMFVEFKFLALLTLFSATLASPIAWRCPAHISNVRRRSCPVTSKEWIDSLPETLMRDDRILSSRERELLSSILRLARSDDPSGRISETLARAIGETISQRAYALLGQRILQGLETNPESSADVLPGFRLGTGPLPTPTPSPQKPGPHPPSPSPPTSPSGIFASRRDGGITPFGQPEPPAAYRASIEKQASFVGPRPPSVSSSASVEHNLAVMESPEILPADCVIFEEFLVPGDLDALMHYTLQHESDFQVSEVLSPGVQGGTVDHEHRRSKVLPEPGEEIRPLVERVRACLPRVLPKLRLSTFPVSHVEAQITASNHGDFFRWHSDNAQEEIASREVTFVYFFHREPKRFHGGELRIYDSLPSNSTYVPATNYRAVVPRQNQIIFFRSSLAHEITPVECPSGAFGDSRFTVNGWFHR